MILPPRPRIRSAACCLTTKALGVFIYFGLNLSVVPKDGYLIILKSAPRVVDNHTFVSNLEIGRCLISVYSFI